MLSVMKFAKVMTEAKKIAMQVIKNEAVTVSAGNTKTQVIDTTIVEDWDAMNYYHVVDLLLLLLILSWVSSFRQSVMMVA